MLLDNCFVNRKYNAFSNRESAKTRLAGQNIAKNFIDLLETKQVTTISGKSAMHSEETDGGKPDVVDSMQTAECVNTLTISLDQSAECGKRIQVGEQAEKCGTLGTIVNDFSDVLKELRNASTTDVLSPSTQILNSTIGNLNHSVSFSTSGGMLVDEIRPVETVAFTADIHSSTDASTQVGRSLATSHALPGITNVQMDSDLPSWAARLKDCEMIGDSYRGYVNTEAELDLLLSIHKEHTHSCWGTRQSPSTTKPSVRLMWKSQYVPYDGIPFLNSGRRAIVMECQYGPRRKGSKVKVEFTDDDSHQVRKAHRPTCPARIYIKRVCKFPKYRIESNHEGIAGIRQAQERALNSLRAAGVENGGEERFYVQFPLEIAHEYHQDDDYVLSQQVSMMVPDHMSPSRLDNRVVDKINELVARGVTGMYEVKHGIIDFVEKDLFDCTFGGSCPPRHNKTYFPTITDLQNHIYQAKLALEAGTLVSLPAPETLPQLPRRDERNRKRKRSEPRRVRAQKNIAFEPIGTLCIQGDQIAVHQDGNLQNSQASLQVTTSAGEQINQLGQVYVMVPSTNSMFTSTDSALGSSINKTASLLQMQVVTVPTAGTGYLTQQGNGSLGLPAPFLSLPVNSLPVGSYGDNQDISITESQTAADSLGKEMPSLIPSSIGEQTIQQQTSLESSTEDLPTTTEPISPAAIAMVTPDITVCENTSESTLSDRIRSFTKSKQPMIIDTIDKGQTVVDYLFSEESHVTTKSNSDISSADADMNNMPCSTEESYNSSLDIIKTHEEILVTSALPDNIHHGEQNTNFSRGPIDNCPSTEVAPQEIMNTTEDLTKLQNEDISSELL